MKVKELREILAGAADDAKIMVVNSPADIWLEMGFGVDMTISVNTSKTGDEADAVTTAVYLVKA